MVSTTPQHQTATSETWELRCPHCGKLMGRGKVFWFEMTCPRCKRLVRLE